MSVAAPVEGGVPVVAIIGGGVSGAGVATHLARRADAAIVVFEPRERLGAGLAYDTTEIVHRINVPASRMTLEPDEPLHFCRWIEGDAEVQADRAAFLPDGRIFPRRNAFGRYVEACLAPLVASGQVRHERRRIAAVTRDGDRWRLVADDGTAFAADIVVVATSHPAPTPPRGLAGAFGDPRLVPDPLAPGALDDVPADARVLVVGVGLTMADVVAGLDRRGHRGPVLAVSRRGQRSRGHGAAPTEGLGDFRTAPETTALGLLRRVRAAVRAANAAGHTWHGVFDTLRRQGGPIWAALPEAERIKLVRHLRPFWDVHRFRIAPQVEAVLERRIAAGTLAIAAASPVAALPGPDGIAVTLRPRGGGPAEERTFDRVVVTTGPGHGALLRGEGFLPGLAADGLLRHDTCGLGLATDLGSCAVGRDGDACDTLFVAGPLARGTFGELMGLPEVTIYARDVAVRVAARLEAFETPAVEPRRAVAAVR